MLLLKTPSLFLIRLYQATISPLTSSCRFQPTCSQYMYEAVSRYGILNGLYKGIKRIARCHPWAKAGFDPLK